MTPQPPRPTSVSGHPGESERTMEHGCRWCKMNCASGEQLLMHVQLNHPVEYAITTKRPPQAPVQPTDERAAISAAQRDWFNRADRWERESMEAAFAAGWAARGEYERARGERLRVALEELIAEIGPDWPDSWDAGAYETAVAALATTPAAPAGVSAPDHLWSMSLPAGASVYHHCCERPQSAHAGVSWEMYQQSGSPDDAP